MLGNRSYVLLILQARCLTFALRHLFALGRASGRLWDGGYESLRGVYGDFEWMRDHERDSGREYIDNLSDLAKYTTFTFCGRIQQEQQRVEDEEPCQMHLRTSSEHG